MSTNYYVRTADTPPDGEGIHLGKFAQGHAFMFRGYPEQGITTYGAWRTLAASGEIVTECGAPVDLADMEKRIAEAHRTYARFRVTRPRKVDQVDDGGHRFTLVEFC
ncbi:hypothetical protein ACIBCR_15355 [Micromonospora echinospora]|uniref:hypothetical protein n=1 Tax=Micromonospora echinospora TaxID=1877 RepID=UPI00378E8308